MDVPGHEHFSYLGQKTHMEAANQAKVHQPPKIHFLLLIENIHNSFLMFFFLFFFFFWFFTKFKGKTKFLNLEITSLMYMVALITICHLNEL